MKKLIFGFFMMTILASTVLAQNNWQISENVNCMDKYGDWNLSERLLIVNDIKTHPDIAR